MYTLEKKDKRGDYLRLSLYVLYVSLTCKFKIGVQSLENTLEDILNFHNNNVTLERKTRVKK